MHTTESRKLLVQHKRRQLALEEPDMPTGESLVTPDHIDKLHKQRSVDVRRALKSTNARPPAVTANPAANGVNAFSAELQIQNESVIPHDTTALDDHNTTVVTPATTAPSSTRKRKTKAAASSRNPKAVNASRRTKTATASVPETAVVPTALLQNKCQGCIHGDLLEMKVMEPAGIKHYLKRNHFLEKAICAGNCNHTIEAIFRASPKAKLYYCDETNKGFDAPDDDLAKADMQCGLILCSPCRALRDIQYTQETTANGSNNRRTSRRSTNK